MAAIEQEEPSTPAVAKTVEVEVEVPVVAEKTSIGAAEAAVEKTVAPVEAKAKRLARTVVGDVKPAGEKLNIDLTDAEKLVVARMENEFLKVNAQITQLQAQASQIQKNFPAYVDSLVKKYAVDVKEYTFNTVEGSFKKNQNK